MKLGVLITLALVITSQAEVLTVRLPPGAMQPRVAPASEGPTPVVFLQGDPRACDVKVAELSPTGDLDAPLTISTPASQAVAVGTVRGPAVAVGLQNVRLLVWHGKSGTAADGTGSALFFSRLEKGGLISPPRDILGNTAGLDGGASITADSAGHVWLVWHALPAGKTGESERRVFLRHSADNGETFSDPWPVRGDNTGVCGCCGLAASTDANGSLYIWYRGAAKAERGARLIRLPATATPATAPERVAQDEWHMPACPMTTAAMLPDAKGVLVAWITGYHLVFSGWAAGTMAADAAVQNHPRLARNAAGETLLLWTEGSAWGKGGDLVWQTFTASHQPVGNPHRDPLPTWSYGACATLAGGRFAIVY